MSSIGHWRDGRYERPVPQPRPMRVRLTLACGHHFHDANATPANMERERQARRAFCGSCADVRDVVAGVIEPLPPVYVDWRTA